MDVSTTILSQLAEKDRAPELRPYKATTSRDGHDCRLPLHARTLMPLDPRTNTQARNIYVQCSCTAVWGICARAPMTFGPSWHWNQMTSEEADALDPDCLVPFDPVTAWEIPPLESITWQPRLLLPNGLTLWQLDFERLRATLESSCSSLGTVENTRLACLLRADHPGKHEAIGTSGYPKEWR